MPKYALIDDTHPDLVYTGQWEALTMPLNPNSPEFNRTVHATVDPNATVSYNFYGSIINFFGSIDAPAIHGFPSPIFQVKPNIFPPTVFNSTGTAPVIPDKNAHVATSHIKMFGSGKFSEGNYTMVVQAGGVGSAATGATFYFDFLVVEVGDETSAEYVILDDTSDQFDYTDGWTTKNITGDYMGSVHRPPTQGGLATTKFHGTEISVYGSIDGPYAEDSLIGFFQIDGGQTHTVIAGNITNDAILNNGVEIQNQLIWSTTGLPVSQGEHTLTISAPPSVDTSISTSSSPSPAELASASASTTSAPTNPAWFLDYVVYGPSSALTPTPTNSSSSNSSSSSSSSSSPRTPPVGAIAGGVIGGLAALALVIVSFLLWRRQLRNRAVEFQDGSRMNELTPAAAFQPGWNPSIRKDSHGGGGGAGVGVAEGPVTADNAHEAENTTHVAQRPVLPPGRETDSGVRQAGGPESDVDSEVRDLLPPPYETRA